LKSKDPLAPGINVNKAKRGTLLRLLSYVRPHWHYALMVAVTVIASTSLSLVQPWVMGFLLVNGVLLQKNLTMLPLVIFVLGGAYIAKELTGYLQQYVTTVLSQRILHALRYDLFQNLEYLPVRFFDDKRAGELVSRIISDTEEVNQVITSAISDLGADLVMVASVFVILFYVNTGLAELVIPVVLTLTITVNVFKKRLKFASKRIREAIGDLAGRTVETISGIRVVKSFSMERQEAKKFEAQSLGIFRSKVRLAMLSQLYSSSIALVTASTVLIVIGFGAPSVVSGSLTVGALVAFLAYLDRLFKPIVDLSKANVDVARATAAGERIFEVMDAGAEPMDLQTGIDPQNIKGEIEFERVFFGYDDSKGVLRNFSLNVRAGQTVAVVGRSGAGKTTLVNLLLRFYEPSSGRISIDRYPIDEWKLNSLRKTIALVPQDPLLFSGTIRENIAYGKVGATDLEIMEAARAANAHDFISSLTGGYDAEIGERGVKLSGGQRQRIAIARALLKNPSILIFDEATSNVDSESEVLIQEALGRLAGEQTIIIIAHRFSTVMHADKIVVLEDGGIVETGEHEELLRRRGIYSRLYEAQFGTK